MDARLPDVISDIEMRLMKKEWLVAGCKVVRDKKRILVGQMKDRYAHRNDLLPLDHYASLTYWRWLACYHKHPLGWGKAFDFR